MIASSIVNLWKSGTNLLKTSKRNGIKKRINSINMVSFRLQAMKKVIFRFMKTLNRYKKRSKPF